MWASTGSAERCIYLPSGCVLSWQTSLSTPSLMETSHWWPKSAKFAAHSTHILSSAPWSQPSCRNLLQSRCVYVNLVHEAFHYTYASQPLPSSVWRDRDRLGFLLSTGIDANRWTWFLAFKATGLTIILILNIRDLWAKDISWWTLVLSRILSCRSFDPRVGEVNVLNRMVRGIARWDNSVTYILRRKQLPAMYPLCFLS